MKWPPFLSFSPTYKPIGLPTQCPGCMIGGHDHGRGSCDNRPCLPSPWHRRLWVAERDKIVGP